MQLEGLLLVLVMLVLIPVFALSSNDTVFFIVVALILFFSSIKSIGDNLLNINYEESEKSSELIDEIEDQVNIDLNKFARGLKVIRNLITILFFVYCTFYISSLWQKSVSILIILFWARELFCTLSSDSTNISEDYHPKSIKLRFVFVIISLCSIILISITAYNKFYLYK